MNHYERNCIVRLYIRLRTWLFVNETSLSLSQTLSTPALRESAAYFQEICFTSIMIYLLKLKECRLIFFYLYIHLICIKKIIKNTQIII